MLGPTILVMTFLGFHVARYTISAGMTENFDSMRMAMEG